MLDDFKKVVTPVKTGVQRIVKGLNRLDSGPFDKLRVTSLPRDFRRNDGNTRSPSLREAIIFHCTPMADLIFQGRSNPGPGEDGAGL